MTCTGEAFHQVNQVKNISFCSMYASDRAGDFKSDCGARKQGIGRAISGAPMQQVLPEDFRMRIERQFHLKEVEHYPSELWKVELTEERGTREEDRRSKRKNSQRVMLA